MGKLWTKVRMAEVDLSKLKYAYDLDNFDLPGPPIAILLRAINAPILKRRAITMGTPINDIKICPECPWFLPPSLSPWGYGIGACMIWDSLPVDGLELCNTAKTMPQKYVDQTRAWPMEKRFEIGKKMCQKYLEDENAKDTTDH